MDQQKPKTIIFHFEKYLRVEGVESWPPGVASGVWKKDEAWYYADHGWREVLQSSDITGQLKMSLCKTMLGNIKNDVFVPVVSIERDYQHCHFERVEAMMLPDEPALKELCRRLLSFANEYNVKYADVENELKKHAKPVLLIQEEGG